MISPDPWNEEDISSPSSSTTAVVVTATAEGETAVSGGAAVTSGVDSSGYVCEEKEGRIYHVEFLGKGHTHNWIVEDKVNPITVC